jgi:hypothetical protein
MPTSNQPKKLLTVQAKAVLLEQINNDIKAAVPEAMLLINNPSQRRLVRNKVMEVIAKYSPVSFSVICDQTNNPEPIVKAKGFKLVAYIKLDDQKGASQIKLVRTNNNPFRRA